MEAECGLCGASFATKSPRAKWCSEACRKRHDRAQARLEVVRELPPSRDGRVAETTRAKLEAAGQLGSPLGAAAVALAQRIDGVSLFDTGSALAALVRELRATLAEATKGTIVANDPIDELRARREAKGAGGGR